MDTSITKDKCNSSDTFSEFTQYTLRRNGQEQRIIPLYSVYMSGALCLALLDVDKNDITRDPITIYLRATDDLPKHSGMAYVDVDHYPYITSFLEENLLAEYVPGRDSEVGPVTYPCYRFDLDKFVAIEKILGIFSWKEK